MLAQAHKGRAAARQSVHVLLSLEASASRAQAEREPSQHARCVYHNERRMQRRTSSAHTCFGSNACDAGSVPPAAGARGVVAYISLRVDVASSGGATGAPQHSSVILTAAPALHVSNLSPWPLRLHAISTPPPGSRPEPSLDPAAERVAAPRATLALPVLWAGGAGAAPAVLVSLAAPGVAGGTEHASAAAAVTGQADGAAADGGGPAGDRAPATCVPLLGAGAWAGRRRRLHVATGPGPCPAAAGGAAGAAPGAPAEAERARGAVVVTYRLLMPPGRAHLVLFRDAQPPLVLRNLCAVAMEVRAPRAWAGRSAEASPRHLAASSTLAVSWMPLCRQGPQGRRPAAYRSNDKAARPTARRANCAGGRVSAIRLGSGWAALCGRARAALHGRAGRRPGVRAAARRRRWPWRAGRRRRGRGRYGQRGLGRGFG